MRLAVQISLYLLLYYVIVRGKEQFITAGAKAWHCPISLCVAAWNWLLWLRVGAPAPIARKGRAIRTSLACSYSEPTPLRDIFPAKPLHISFFCKSYYTTCLPRQQAFCSDSTKVGSQIRKLPLDLHGSCSVDLRAYKTSRSRLCRWSKGR